MREFVAVNDPSTIISLSSSKDINLHLLRQEALIFNRVAIPKLGKTVLSKKDVLGISADSIRELVWLLENGFIFEPEIDYDALIEGEEFKKTRDSIIKHGMEMAGIILGLDVEEAAEASDEESMRRLQERVKICRS